MTQTQELHLLEEERFSHAMTIARSRERCSVLSSQLDEMRDLLLTQGQRIEQSRARWSRTNAQDVNDLKKRHDELMGELQGLLGHRETADALQGQLEALSAKVADVESENAELKRLVREAEDAENLEGEPVISSDVEMLEMAVEHLSNEIEEHLQDKKRLYEEISEGSLELANMQRKTSHLEGELESLRHNFRCSQSRIANLEAAVQEKDANVQSLVDSLATAEQQTANEVALREGLTLTASRLASWEQELQTRASQLQEAVAHLDKDMTALKANQARQESAEDLLTTREGALDEGVRILIQRVSQWEEERELAEQELTDRSSQLDAEHEELRSKLLADDRKVKQMESEVWLSMSELNEEITELRRSQSAVLDDLNIKSCALHSLEEEAPRNRMRRVLLEMLQRFLGTSNSQLEASLQENASINAECSESIRTIEGLRRSVCELEEQKRIFRATLTDVEVQFKEFRDFQQSLYDAKVKDYTSVEEEAQELSAEVTILRSEIEETKSQLYEAQEGGRVAVAENHELKSQLEAARTDLSAAKQGATLSSQEVVDLKAQYEAELGALRSTVEAMEEKMNAEILCYKEEHQASIERLAADRQAEFAELQTTCAAQTLEVERLSSENGTLVAEMRILVSESRHLKASIEMKDVEMEARKLKLKSVEEQVRDLETTCFNQARQIEEKTAECTETGALLTAASSELQTAHTASEYSRGVAQAAVIEKSNAQNELTRLQRQYEFNSSRIEDLQTQTQSLTESLTEKNAEAVKLRQEWAEATHQISELDRLLASKEQLLGARETQMVNLENELMIMSRRASPQDEESPIFLSPCSQPDSCLRWQVSQ